MARKVKLVKNLPIPDTRHHRDARWVKELFNKMGVDEAVVYPGPMTRLERNRVTSMLQHCKKVTGKVFETHVTNDGGITVWRKA